jgi:hypothetical protein
MSLLQPEPTRSTRQRLETMPGMDSPFLDERSARVEASVLFPIHESRLSAGSATPVQQRHHARCQSADCSRRGVFGFLQRGRVPGHPKDHLFIVLRKADGWGTVVPIRYAGDDKTGYNSTDDEPHLSPDHRTFYFSSDRAVPAPFPRSPEQAQLDFKNLDSLDWFSGYANVWSIPISASLNVAEAGIGRATK